LTNNRTFQFSLPAAGIREAGLEINGGKGSFANNVIVNFDPKGAPKFIAALAVNNSGGRIKPLSNQRTRRELPPFSWFSPT